MERIKSILSIISKSGASLGVLKHAVPSKKFNSITCNENQNYHGRNIKNKHQILWVLPEKNNLFEGEKKINLPKNYLFSWEENKHSISEDEHNLHHNLKIDLKVHKDLNDLIDEKNKNKYVSINWMTNGYSTYWKLSFVWNQETKEETNS